MSNPQLNKVGKNWDITASRVYSNSNTNLTLDASGNSSLFIKTNGLNRAIIGKDISGNSILTSCVANFGTVDTSNNISNMNTYGTYFSNGISALKIPADSSNNRPSGQVGYIRYNTDTNFLEYWNVQTNAWASSAQTLAITDTTTTNATFFPTFVDASGGIVSIRCDSQYLRYNPNTNILQNVNFLASNGTTQTQTEGGLYITPTETTRSTIVTTTNQSYLWKVSNNSTALTNSMISLNSGNSTNFNPSIDIRLNYDYTSSILSYSPKANRILMGEGEYLTITDNWDVATNELPENSIKLRSSSTYTQNNITLRSAFEYVGFESNLVLGYNEFILSIGNYNVFRVPDAGFNTPLQIRRRLNFLNDTNVANTGVLENSSINATTTGSTTLTTLQAFQTIINTPSAAGRIFVLPTAAVAQIGYWYAICNKSATAGNIITVQSSAGVTLGTIPITTAGGAGNVAKFAVDSAGTGYYRVA